MILTPHILVGATIGIKTKKSLLIIILGLLSHFILDIIPHWDYSLSNIRHFSTTKDYNLLFIDISKILIDVIIGLLIVIFILRKKIMLNKNYIPYVVLGIFVSVLPDILWVLAGFVENELLDKFVTFHHHLHYKPQKEGMVTFLGLITQIVTILIAILFLNHIPQKFGKNSGQGNSQNHSENSA